MICPKCYKPIQSSEDICQFCKASIVSSENNPIDKYKEKTDQIVKKAEARAAEIKERIRVGFKGPQAHITGSRSMHREETSAHQEAILSSSFNSKKRMFENKTTREIELMCVQIRKWQQDYLMEMMNTLMSNPNLLDNYKHKEKIKLIKPGFFEWGDYDVNGHAGLITDREGNPVMTPEGHKYRITICEGYVNFAYAIAACIVDVPGKIGIYDMVLLKDVMDTYKENDYSFSFKNLMCLLPEEKPITEIGPNASSIIFECLAHELGHICLNHNYGPGYKFSTSTTNMEEEHQADGFARIIIDRSGFREQLWKGYIQYQTAQSAINFSQRKESLYKPLTHPSAIERLKEGIRKFPDLSKKYGIDEQWAEDLVTNIHNWLK